MRSFFIALATLLAGAACAQTVQPFNAPSGFGIVSNKGGGLYGPTSAAPNWHVTQWGAPGLMQSFTAKGDGTYETDNAFATIKIAANSETITQDGAAIACLTPRGKPAEFDTFIEPTPAALNTSLYPAKKDFPSLAQLTSFTVDGTVTVNGDRPSPGATQCAFNQANAHYSIFLVDAAVQPRQMLWYDVQIARFCEPDPSAVSDKKYLMCLRRPLSVQWYWTGMQGHPHLTKDKDGNIVIVNFAVSDIPQSFGLTEVSGNNPANFNFDFLPRLATLIGSGQYGIDPNLADWRVANISYGQSLWGSTYLSTTWQGFVPSWTLSK